jgi:hypothetical protein
VEKVVKRIRSLGRERAVLIPHELLGLLPLHAAWTEQHGRPVYALDYVAFAPSARLLTHARQLAQVVPAELLLAVDEPRLVTLGVACLLAGINPVETPSDKTLSTTTLSNQSEPPPSLRNFLAGR